MANFFQKMIYNLSVAIPVGVLTAIIWIIQKKTYIIPTIIISVCVLVLIVFIASFCYGNRRIAPILIRTVELSPHDSWVCLYIITYLLPFASVVVDDFNVYIISTISVIVILLLGFSNINCPSPLLMMGGYHFYQATAENGISNYVVISKRKIRHKKELKKVKRVFEFLLIDVEV